MNAWRVITGDCREVLAGLDAGSAHTCVTSPPYFGLRDYGHDGQIGLEPSPDEFVAALVAVFRDVRRVLRDDGTVWLNLGDSYANGGGPTQPHRDTAGGFGGSPGTRGTQGYAASGALERPVSIGGGVKPKDLLGIPWLVAFALRADGWFLRSEIIWHKPNPMPESVTDRPTKAHEQVFLLSKQPRYWYDADAIREAASQPAGDAALTGQHKAAVLGHTSSTSTLGSNQGPPERNKRSVWTVATQPYSGAHFAAFPPKLVEPCVLAGCPIRCCVRCGSPWTRQAWGTTCFKPSCDCNCGTTAGTVLDPFNGAGTTGLVALRHNRSYVGIELNPEYADLARQRIRDDAPLLNTTGEAA